MGNPWKNHGNFMGKNPWIPMKTWSWSKIPWFSWGYFHAFHASMAQENWKNNPHEIMGYETMENHRKHGKHGNLQK